MSGTKEGKEGRGKTLVEAFEDALRERVGSSTGGEEEAGEGPIFAGADWGKAGPIARRIDGGGGAFVSEGGMPTDGGDGVGVGTTTRRDDGLSLGMPVSLGEFLELYDKLVAALACMEFASVELRADGGDGGRMPRMRLEAVGRGCLMASEVLMRGAKAVRAAALAHDDDLVDKAARSAREGLSKGLDGDVAPVRLVAMDPFGESEVVDKAYVLLRDLFRDETGMSGEGLGSLTRKAIRLLERLSKESCEGVLARMAGTLAGTKLSIGTKGAVEVGDGSVGLGDIVERRKGKGSW